MRLDHLTTKTPSLQSEIFAEMLALFASQTDEGRAKLCAFLHLAGSLTKSSIDLKVESSGNIALTIEAFDPSPD